MSTQHSAELSEHPIPPNTPHILRLPEEIFVAIVALCLDVDAVDYKRQINKLRRVCRSWNKVIRHTPRFWVTIKDTDGPNWTQLALKCSGSQPLDIRYGTFGDLGCFPLLLPHIHRFGSLSLRIPADSSSLPEEIGTHPAPKLTCLTLSAWHEASMNDRPDETATLFAGQVSRIRSLSVDYVSVPWDSSFTLLEHLTLQRLHSSAPSVSQLLDILATCPQISSLKIQHVLFKKDDRPLAERVTLPRLETFETALLSPSDAQELFLRLHLPACSHLELGCAADFQDYETDFLSFLHKLSKSQIGRAEFKSAASGRPRIHLDYRRFHFQLKGLLAVGNQERATSFLLKVRTFTPTRFLSDIAALWGSSLNGEAGVDVGLNFGRANEFIVKSRLDAVYSTFPGTKRLFISYGHLFPTNPGGFTSSVLLGPLREPVALAGDGNGDGYSCTWRLPRLSRITIRYSDQIAPELSSLVHMRMMSRDPTVAPAVRLGLVILGHPSTFTVDVRNLKDICEDVELMSEDDCPAEDMELVT